MKINEESWEEHFAPSKRQFRQERKFVVAHDRSKYKKTDKDKREEHKKKHHQAHISQLIHGDKSVEHAVVTLIRSQDFYIMIGGKTKIARLRGNLKLENDAQKNLVIVGDEVLATEQSDGTCIVHTILARRSLLCRQDNLNRVKRHLLAANITQVFITVSVVNPHLRPAIIDRYIIAAEKGGIKPVILINKIDLLEKATEEEELLYHEVVRVYRSLFIPVLCLSMKTGEGMQDLIACMKDHTSVFSGQSGTGKSSLINHTTGLSLRVGNTVEKTKKGSHTTTFAQLIALSQGGFCIDTPGIKSFGIWELEKDDIRAGYPEIAEIGASCQFSNCWHQGEIGCCVVDTIEKYLEQETADENPLLSPLRYASYLSLLQEIDEKRRRR